MATKRSKCVIARLVDNPHPAFSETRKDLVVTQTLSQSNSAANPLAFVAIPKAGELKRLPACSCAVEQVLDFPEQLFITGTSFVQKVTPLARLKLQDAL